MQSSSQYFRTQESLLQSQKPRKRWETEKDSKQHLRDIQVESKGATGSDRIVEPHATLNWVIEETIRVQGAQKTNLQRILPS